MIDLHDRYALDARDPNTYTNILWCFGLHDRPWPERPIYGTVRSMSRAGMERKTDVEAYIRRNRGNSVKITISGASGLIGRRLLKTLAADGHTLHVLSRHAGTNMPAGVRVSPWDPVKGEPPAEALADADAVIHLAGEPVAQRWTRGSEAADSREPRGRDTRNLVRAHCQAAAAAENADLRLGDRAITDRAATRC